MRQLNTSHNKPTLTNPGLARITTLTTAKLICLKIP